MIENDHTEAVLEPTGEPVEGAKFFGGWWMPELETHLCGVMQPGAKRHRTLKSRWAYQINKLDMAMAYVPSNRRRRCVDIGAHIGLWTYYLVDLFETIECFEPVELHQRCWERNIWDADISPEKARLWKNALGDKGDVVQMDIQADSSGDAHIATEKKVGHGKAEIQTLEIIYMTRLDQFGWDDVDFIKIDVEGTERAVVQGAIETIARCKPVILVEQKGNDKLFYGQERDAARIWLEEQLGMKTAKVWSGDTVMVWDA
jgi:FkbM family methyltransferase